MSHGGSATRKLGAGLLGAAGLIAVVTLISRLVGFGRWFVQAHTIGPTVTGQVYSTANQIPNVLFEVVAGGALAGAIVPLLAAPIARRIRADVNQISSAMLTWSLSVLVPLAFVIYVFAEPIVRLLSIEGDDRVALGVALLRMFAWQVPFYGLSIVFTGILQAQKKFFWPAFAPLLNSVVVIGSYLAFSASSPGNLDRPGSLPNLAVMWLGWGTTAGVIAMSLPLIIPVLRTGVRLRLTWRFPEGVARRALRLALAGIGALIAQQGAMLVIVFVANRFGTSGTINVYQYTQAVYFLPYAILAVPLATSSFTRLADRVSEQDDLGYARMIATITRGILVVAVLGAAVLCAVSPAVEVLFSVVSDNTEGSVDGMSKALSVMAPGLVGYALIFSLSRALYAREHNRAAVLATSGGWVVVAVVTFLAAYFGTMSGNSREATLVSLGIGNTVGMTVAGIALLWAVRRLAGEEALRGLPRTALVVSVAAVGAVSVGRWVVTVLLPLGSPTIGALIAGVAGAVLSAAIVVIVTQLADPDTFRNLLHINKTESALGGNGE